MTSQPTTTTADDPTARDAHTDWHALERPKMLAHVTTARELVERILATDYPHGRDALESELTVLRLAELVFSDESPRYVPADLS